MIDRSRCMAPRDPTVIGGDRCQAPATHDSPFGPRCDRCAERLRSQMRDPSTLGNVLTGGGARTEEQIARLVPRLAS